ncbi:septum formation initiator family protein [Micrococcus sp. EYE_162]|uniref:FtsB family cell division protein n=1 Tax=unclassified Micrococcus TaxID=2620948 RepID=UPI002002A46C|nr:MULTISPECIES: septum formation initiator family protein [unclassified Micrococcus]MCK6094703.1 septum formation initiator family protein [Micrococcus sp. EYE_212]MCK6171245.1 septum formation initiator family protein [Micrococcus sp. EYE_162]
MSPRRPRVPRVDPALAPQDPDAAAPRATPDPTPAAEPTRQARPEPTRQARPEPTRQARPGPVTLQVVTTGPAEEEADVEESAPSSSAPATADEAPPRAPRRAAQAGAVSQAARRRAPLPEPVPARQITGRSLLVVAALLVAAVLLAPTLRVFLNQQLEISATRADIAERKEEQARYEERIRRWDDPAYVAQQARDRLDLVMPGETLYTVSGLPEEGATPAEDEDQPAPTDAVNARLPWAEGLWDSVVRSATE